MIKIFRVLTLNKQIEFINPYFKGEILSTPVTLAWIDYIFCFAMYIHKSEAVKSGFNLTVFPFVGRSLISASPTHRMTH